MIKTRLMGLLSHAKKYIAYTILWQWAALLSQVLAVFSIADLLEQVAYRGVTVPIIERTILILFLVLVIRFVCERMGARSSYLACVDVKRILREKIYEKMLKLGASYSEQVSSSEVVQVSTEGVEQLETYFGKYLPQLFYSLIAPAGPGCPPAPAGPAALPVVACADCRRCGRAGGAHSPSHARAHGRPGNRRIG